MSASTVTHTTTMLTLPGDAVRQIQWRFADRFDLQMLVQSARGVARGTVARLVAAGERNTHEWTPAKDEMMDAFDRAGINRGLHGAGRRRLHRRAQESRAGACGLRAGMGRWRSRDGEPRRIPGPRADP